MTTRKEIITAASLGTICVAVLVITIIYSASNANQIRIRKEVEWQCGNHRPVDQFGNVVDQDWRHLKYSVCRELHSR